mmetsp:Transcript_44671/g.94984  ORF Transcript_44671/g.94984 Transcript_44671/m.94984 type:complete len:160 (-) Transcript_44671:210-689(-)
MAGEEFHEAHHQLDRGGDDQQRETMISAHAQHRLHPAAQLNVDQHTLNELKLDELKEMNERFERVADELPPEALLTAVGGAVGLMFGTMLCFACLPFAACCGIAALVFRCWRQRRESLLPVSSAGVHVAMSSDPAGTATSAEFAEKVRRTAALVSEKMS